MNIKAIETTYKGYKFRSRLEARWAVFFDSAGIEWQYEVEGFELPSGRYLPDFTLPTLRTHVEIKPPPFAPFHRPKIYMAGRMGWRNCYRPFDIDLGNNGPFVFRDTVFGKTHIRYCGPFRDLSDHGMLRRHDGRCSEDLKTIYNRSVRGIDSANIFFALFEDLEAFGTLVELGIAKEAGKFVIVGITGPKFSDPEYCEDASDGYYEHRPNDQWDNLWFATQSANLVLDGTRDEILGKFQGWLEAEFPMSREQVLAMELSGNSEFERVTMCYGDPFDAVRPDPEGGNGGVIEFAKGEPLTPNRSVLFTDCSKFREAALDARQARFEYGQSGAR